MKSYGANSLVETLQLARAAENTEQAQHGKEATTPAPWREGRSRQAVTGDVAAIEAAMKADAMLDKGDLDGAAVWRRIVAAVNEMLSIRPGDGDAIH